MSSNLIDRILIGPTGGRSAPNGMSINLIDRVLVGLLVLALAIGAILIGHGLIFGFGDTEQPPYGCVWVDMNPSKGADYQLACVPGYPKEN